MVSGSLLQPQHTAFQPGWQLRVACMRLGAWTGCHTPFRGSVTAVMESLQSYWRRYIRFVKQSPTETAQQGVTKFQVLLKPVCGAASECHKLCLCTQQDHSCLKACGKCCDCCAHHGLGQVVLSPAHQSSHLPWQLSVACYVSPIKTQPRLPPHDTYCYTVASWLNSIAPVCR